MALSSDVQSVSVSKKVKSVDFAVKSNVEIFGEKQVYKLLSVKSNVAVKEITMQENNVIFNGNLYYDVLYITKNGDFEKANCIAEFSSKIDGSYKDVSIFASVVDTKTSISADGTMLEFNSAIKAECENVFKENIVVPQGLESLYTKKENDKLLVYILAQADFAAVPFVQTKIRDSLTARIEALFNWFEGRYNEIK